MRLRDARWELRKTRAWSRCCPAVAWAKCAGWVRISPLPRRCWQRSLVPRRRAPLQFLAPMATPELAHIFAQQVRQAGAVVRLVDRDADTVLAAADAALVASGTATLQTLLYGCPMVVAYRVAPLTAFLAREMGLVKVKHVSQPNLLAGEELVPELLQEAVTPPALAAALKVALEDTDRRALLQQRFRSIHLQLRQGGAARAAQCVLDQLAAARARI